MSEKVVVGRDEMDRLVLMRMDLDRYEAQLIPDLYEEIHALRNALRRLVQVIQEGDTPVSPDACNRHSAVLHDAERLLGERSEHSRKPAGGHPQQQGQGQGPIGRRRDMNRDEH